MQIVEKFKEIFSNKKTRSIVLIAVIAVVVVLVILPRIGNFNNPADSFHLSVSSGGGAPPVLFYIWKENRETYFECNPGFSPIYADILTKVDESVLDDLVQVIRENKITRWNMFNKRAMYTDGGGFSIHMKRGTLSLQASGYGGGSKYEPRRFREGYNVLIKFLTDYYENLQMPELGPDSIYMIEIPNENYRIQLYYGQNGGLASTHIYEISDIAGSTYDSGNEDIKIDLGLAKQLRDRVLGYEINKWDASMPAEQYVRLWYNGIKIDNHSCYALLPPEEADSLNTMALEIFGLPSDYDWGGLLVKKTEPEPPPPVEFDRNTRVMTIIDDSELGRIRCQLPQAYTSYDDSETNNHAKYKYYKVIRILNGSDTCLILYVMFPNPGAIKDLEECEKIKIGNDDWYFTIDGAGCDIYYAETERYVLNVVTLLKNNNNTAAVQELLRSFVLE